MPVTEYLYPHGRQVWVPWSMTQLSWRLCPSCQILNFQDLISIKPRFHQLCTQSQSLERISTTLDVPGFWMASRRNWHSLEEELAIQSLSGHQLLGDSSELCKAERKNSHIELSTSTWLLSTPLVAAMRSNSVDAKNWEMVNPNHLYYSHCLRWIIIRFHPEVQRLRTFISIEMFTITANCTVRRSKPNWQMSVNSKSSDLLSSTSECPRSLVLGNHDWKYGRIGV